MKAIYSPSLWRLMSGVLEYYRHMFTPVSKEVAQSKIVSTIILLAHVYSNIQSNISIYYCNSSNWTACCCFLCKGYHLHSVWPNGFLNPCNQTDSKIYFIAFPPYFFPMGCFAFAAKQWQGNYLAWH